MPGPGKDPANWGYPYFYVHLLPGSPPRTAPSSVPGESSSFSGLSQLESWVLPLETSVHTSASWLTRGRGLEPCPRPPPQQCSVSPRPREAFHLPLGFPAWRPSALAVATACLEPQHHHKGRALSWGSGRGPRGPGMRAQVGGGYSRRASGVPRSPWSPAPGFASQA